MNRFLITKRALSAGLFALSAASFVPAQVCYVDGGSGSDSNSGTSRLAPLETLEAGLALASSLGTIDEIRLTTGTYVPGSASGDSFDLVDGISIQGGYSSGFLVRGLGSTVLDGSLSRKSVVRAIDVHGVRLEKLVIRNGFGGQPVDGISGGAGLFLEDSSVLVVECEFENNYGGSYGGAAWVTGTSNATFSNCTFLDNVAHRGGALALGSEQDGDVLVLQCSFFGNQGSIAGGAICHYDGEAGFWNSEFSGNSSYEGACLSFLGSGPDARIGNCTMAGNHAVVGGGVAVQYSDVAITNSIIRGNTSSLVNPDLHSHGGAFTLRYNCLGSEAMAFGGFRNFDRDPNLVDLDGPDDVLGTRDDDLSIHHPDLATSPCVDRGNNADIDGAHLQLDRPGATRKQRPRTGDTRDPRVDVGAFEVQPIDVPFPGSDEGLELRVLEDDRYSHRFGSDGLLVTAGQNLKAYLESPGGGRTGSIGAIFLDFLPSGTGLGLPLPIADVYFSGSAVPISALVERDAFALDVTVPGGLAGTGLLLQGLVLDRFASNGVGATTNARLVEFY